jgi:beta-lactamase superfamily II metal-dependent hydrolase
MASTETPSKIRIRAYNVRFGDCVLISFDGSSGEKHILVDFGNAPAGVQNEGGKNDVFAPVARDLAKRTKKRIDLLVMSHEHLDHMEGFYSERAVFDNCTVGEVWMSIMSSPDYYRRFPQCEPERRARIALLDKATSWQKQGYFESIPGPLRALIANNVLNLANKERIDYLRKLVSAKHLRYLSRRAGVTRATSLGGDVKIEVLAPEQDASVYYKIRNQRLWLDAAARLGAVGGKRRKRTAVTPPKVPSHMAPDEFSELRDQIAEMDMSDLLAIDKAANNTSLVLRITVHGKVLLLPGDAEAESWAIMKKAKILGPVDFLKLAHHGSINGMPFEGTDQILNRVLKPGRKTVALVSTCRGVYGDTRETEIPQHRLVARLKEKCAKVYITQDAAPFGEGFDIVL